MHIEDLKPGEFVAIVKCNDTGHSSTCCLHGTKCQSVQYDGMPLKVIAISPPFVYVFDRENDRRGAVDFRRFEFTRLTKEYVKAVRDEQDYRKSVATVTVKCGRCGFDSATANPNT